MLMQDRNSPYVFNIIEHWLKQFSTTTIGIESKQDNKGNNNLYLIKTTGNEVLIGGISIDGYEYHIYSISGRLLKKSTVVNRQIDVSGMPNGVLFVSFSYKEQLITKRIIRNRL